jgi:hypothetical protein
MHEQRAVYTISPDVGQRLEKSCMHERCAHELAFFQDLAGGQRREKSCMHERCAHELAFFQDLAGGQKKNSDLAYFFFCAKNSWFGGLINTRVSFLEKKTSQV